MHGILKLGFAGILSAATVIGAASWYAIAPPSPDRLELFASLVDNGSAAGGALLQSPSVSRADYDALSPHFVAQARRGYCGVASATVVLNALDPAEAEISQDRFFTPRASTVRSSLRVTLAGMTLAQLAELLRAHDATVELVYATQTNLATFRALVRRSVDDSSDFIIVNYDRAALHQRGGGHLSPIAAYHAESDRVLVLDVAAHRYPPTWVPTAELWDAMKHIDRSSGMSRGFVVVRKVGRIAPAARSS